MAVAAKRFRLQHDVPRLRGIEPQGLPQDVDGVWETAEAEQEVPLLEPRPRVRAVQLHDVSVAFDCVLLPAQQDQDVGPIEPEADLAGAILEKAIVGCERGVVVALLEEGLGLLPELSGMLFFVDLSRY